MEYLDLVPGVEYAAKDRNADVTIPMMCVLHMRVTIPVNVYVTRRELFA